VSLLLINAVVPLMAINHTNAPATSETHFSPVNHSYLGLFYRANSIFIKDADVCYSVPGLLIPLEGVVSLRNKENKQIDICSRVEVSPGTTIITGPTGSAELRWPDGTVVLIAPETELYLAKSCGVTTYLLSEDDIEQKSPKFLAGDELNLVTTFLMKDIIVHLPRGLIYGVMVPTKERHMGNEYPESLSHELDSISEGVKEQPVRVKVNMPWGVAGVRGTIWMNLVENSREITTVITGSVQLYSGEAGVLIEPGYYSGVEEKRGIPFAPQIMTSIEEEYWLRIKEWLFSAAYPDAVLPSFLDKGSNVNRPSEAIAHNADNAMEVNRSEDNYLTDDQEGSYTPVNQENGEYQPVYGRGQPVQGGFVPPGIGNLTPAAENIEPPGKGGVIPAMAGGLKPAGEPFNEIPDEDIASSDD